MPVVMSKYNQYFNAAWCFLIPLLTGMYTLVQSVHADYSSLFSSKVYNTLSA